MTSHQPPKYLHTRTVQYNCHSRRILDTSFLFLIYLCKMTWNVDTYMIWSEREMKCPCLEAQNPAWVAIVLYCVSVKIFWWLMTGHSCDPGELWVSWAQERRGAGVLTLTKRWPPANAMWGPGVSLPIVTPVTGMRSIMVTVPHMTQHMPLLTDSNYTLWPYIVLRSLYQRSYWSYNNFNKKRILYK